MPDWGIECKIMATENLEQNYHEENGKHQHRLEN